ncbi:hypothetical protein SNEBB_001726 [Seison nebaliae]|nr:hypothetical protein SNEBB_001726 [Seison nebaliae]
MCRVCRSEGVIGKDLFYPCRCSGSIKFIHQQCLKQWMNYSRSATCELCKFKFNFQKVYLPGTPSRMSFFLLLRAMFMFVVGKLRGIFHIGFAIFCWTIFVPLVIWQLSYKLFYNRIIIYHTPPPVTPPPPTSMSLNDDLMKEPIILQLSDSDFIEQYSEDELLANEERNRLNKYYWSMGKDILYGELFGLVVVFSAFCFFLFFVWVKDKLKNNVPKWLKEHLDELQKKIGKGETNDEGKKEGFVNGEENSPAKLRIARINPLRRYQMKRINIYGYKIYYNNFKIFLAIKRKVNELYVNYLKRTIEKEEERPNPTENDIKEMKNFFISSLKLIQQFDRSLKSELEDYDENIIEKRLNEIRTVLNFNLTRTSIEANEILKVLVFSLNIDKSHYCPGIDNLEKEENGLVELLMRSLGKLFIMFQLSRGELTQLFYFSKFNNFTLLDFIDRYHLFDLNLLKFNQFADHLMFNVPPHLLFQFNSRMNEISMKNYLQYFFHYQHQIKRHFSLSALEIKRRLLNCSNNELSIMESYLYQSAHPNWNENIRFYDDYSLCLKKERMSKSLMKFAEFNFLTEHERDLSFNMIWVDCMVTSRLSSFSLAKLSHKDLFQFLKLWKENGSSEKMNPFHILLIILLNSSYDQDDDDDNNNNYRQQRQQQQHSCAHRRLIRIDDDDDDDLDVQQENEEEEEDENNLMNEQVNNDNNNNNNNHNEENEENNNHEEFPVIPPPAEELTWTNFLGFDGKFSFIEHILWLISLIFIFLSFGMLLPHEIGGHLVALSSPVNKALMTRPVYHAIIAIFIGYIMLSIWLYIAFKLSFYLRDVHLANIFAITYLVIRTGLFIIYDLVLIPLAIGFILDLLTLDISGQTVDGRLLQLANGPTSFLALHYVPGIFVIIVFWQHMVFLKERMQSHIFPTLHQTVDDEDSIKNLIILDVHHTILGGLQLISVISLIMISVILPSVYIIKSLIPSTLPYHLDDDYTISLSPNQFDLILNRTIPLHMSYRHRHKKEKQKSKLFSISRPKLQQIESPIRLATFNRYSASETKTIVDDDFDLSNEQLLDHILPAFTSGSGSASSLNSPHDLIYQTFFALISFCYIINLFIPTIILPIINELIYFNSMYERFFERFLCSSARLFGIYDLVMKSEEELIRLFRRMYMNIHQENDEAADDDEDDPDHNPRPNRENTQRRNTLTFTALIKRSMKKENNSHQLTSNFYFEQLKFWKANNKFKMFHNIFFYQLFCIVTFTLMIILLSLRVVFLPLITIVAQRIDRYWELIGLARSKISSGFHGIAERFRQLTMVKIRYFLFLLFIWIFVTLTFILLLCAPIFIGREAMKELMKLIYYPEASFFQYLNLIIFSEWKASKLFGLLEIDDSAYLFLSKDISSRIPLSPPPFSEFGEMLRNIELSTIVKNLYLVPMSLSPALFYGFPSCHVMSLLQNMSEEEETGRKGRLFEKYYNYICQFKPDESINFPQCDLPNLQQKTTSLRKKFPFLSYYQHKHVLSRSFTPATYLNYPNLTNSFQLFPPENSIYNFLKNSPNHIHWEYSEQLMKSDETYFLSIIFNDFLIFNFFWLLLAISFATYHATRRRLYRFYRRHITDGTKLLWLRHILTYYRLILLRRTRLIIIFLDRMFNLQQVDPSKELMRMNVLSQFDQSRNHHPYFRYWSFYCEFKNNLLTKCLEWTYLNQDINERNEDENNRNRIRRKRFPDIFSNSFFDGSNEESENSIIFQRKYSTTDQTFKIRLRTICLYYIRLLLALFSNLVVTMKLVSRSFFAAYLRQVMLRNLKHFGYYLIQCTMTVSRFLFVFIFAMGFVPFLYGLIVELIIFRPVNQTFDMTSETSEFISTWSTGAFFLKLRVFTELMLNAQGTFIQEILHLYARGIEPGAVFRLWRTIVRPTINFAIIILLLPFIFIEFFAIPIIGNNLVLYTHLNQWIYCYYFILLGCGFLINLFIKSLKRLQLYLHDEKYLIGTLLVNYDNSMPSTTTSS